MTGKKGIVNYINFLDLPTNIKARACDKVMCVETENFGCAINKAAFCALYSIYDDPDVSILFEICDIRDSISERCKLVVLAVKLFDVKHIMI